MKETNLTESHPYTREELEAREAELVKREQQLIDDLQGPHDRNLEDQAAERENDEVWAALLNQTRSELAEVRSALLRIAEHH